MDRIAISGIDEALGIRQTGGDCMRYRRFLKRFPEDDTFLQLGNSLIAGCLQDAFLHAHTLKGLTAQLGITALYAPAQTLCELLRPPRTDALDEAKMLFDGLCPIYHRIIGAIRAL